MSTLRVSNIQDTAGSNNSTPAAIANGIAKAWVNFTGSTGSIRASYNVSSITRNTTGDYTVNFTTALADANYSAVASTSWSGAVSRQIVSVASNSSGLVAPTTGAVRLNTVNYASGTAYDSDYVFFAAFR